MEQLANFQTQEFKYLTMVEMTAHIETLGAAGWSLEYVSSLTLTAIYRKDLP